MQGVKTLSLSHCVQQLLAQELIMSPSVYKILTCPTSCQNLVAIFFLVLGANKVLILANVIHEPLLSNQSL